MSLDIFQDDTRDALANATRNMAPSLPAGFTDTFHAAWDNGLLFSQSIAGRNARSAAIADYADDIYRRTGDPTLHPAVIGDDLDGMNARIERLSAERPDLNLKPLTEDEATARAADKSRVSREAYAAMAKREKTWGGTLGSIVGGIASAAIDPVNVIAFPLAAPEAMGVLGATVAWSGIAGGTQLATEVLGAPFREQVEPGYSTSIEPVANVLGAGAFGGALGGSLKALANGWQRIKPNELPRSIRDAGNVVESEANIAETNPFVRSRMPSTVEDAGDGHFFVRSAAADTGDMLSLKVGPDAVQVGMVTVGKANRGQGVATSLYEKALEFAGERGLPLRSDVSVSTDAMRVYEALRRRGYEVIEAADSTPNSAGITNLGAGYVYEVKPKPGVDPAVAEVAHRDATAKAIDDVINGRPVDVSNIIKPEMEAAIPETTGPAATSKAPEPPQPRSQREQSALNELAKDIAPQRVEELRADDEVADTVLRDLDKLRAEKGDIEIPMGETVDANGNTVAVTRKVGDVLAEADARESASRELMLCLGPQPEPGA